MLTRRAFLASSAAAAAGAAPFPAPGPLTLWYRRPAKQWVEALPVGNGRLGAMVFGGIDSERIQLNEETIWDGFPRDVNNPEAFKALPDVRRLLFEGRNEEATALSARTMMGIPQRIRSYQPLGDLRIEFPDLGGASDYRRELDLDAALAAVRLRVGGVLHTREVFASRPDNVIVVRIAGDRPGSVNARFTLTRQQDAQCLTDPSDPQRLILRGRIDCKDERTGEQRGMRFEGHLAAIPSGGTVSNRDGVLAVEHADSVLVLIAAATGFRGRDPEAECRAHLKAAQKPYPALRQRHAADHRALFRRVSLDLGAPPPEAVPLPTDERLARVQKGAEDPALVAQYFQFGRYLLIASSRPGCLPANLQGVWNEHLKAPWNSDYHTNINLQMIYWATEVGNLPECHLPLAEYIKSLQTPGEKTTKAFFDMPGWTVNTMNNAFGYTAPGWGLPWGFFPGGAAWLCRHIWEHYEYTQDKEFLKRMMPTLTESVRFWHHYLTADSEGKLSSSPSYSPEHGEISTGATMDHQIVWDLYSNYLKACNILNISNEFTSKTEADLKALYPLKIGRWGQLQEWKEDVDDPKSTHRHVSHLYGLYPGYQITPEATPELAAASKISLDARGDGGTGWSLAWKINFRARLKDGNHAHKMLQNLLKPVGSSGSGFDNSGGTYPNLFCAHPPFQLDGNMGGAAGIAEMLLQSHLNEIELLPALPDTWLKGEVKGLKARGNHTVDINWNSGKLTSAMIKSPAEGKVKVRYGAKTIEVDVKANKAVKISEANFR